VTYQTSLTRSSWSAVVRGATLRALVKKRVTRAAYGVRFNEIWTREKHEQGPLAEFALQHKVLNAADDQYHCYDRMRWYVKKGEEFDDMKTVDFAFYRPISIHSQFKFEVELWAYADCDDGQEGPPFRDIDCHLVIVIPVDLSTIDRSQLPKLKNKAGDSYYKLSYSLEMTFDSMVHFRLKYKDRAIGVETKYVEYDLRGRDILQ